ncbi:hypothetical protein ND856_14155 [Leptospira bandrabouensis]|uniref:hypothetical protein n=1 Tax=Leptospira bandrabouensis TaxID=2484903 RepID=UPI00223DD998|nr:hypothetical protein [Leptospira bandrabouensis]MCW7459548.1 hypothetical protein [Leptospira bandrabouensis]MCW7478434.1 hypothetical protein [Leptospira bandrabouensis]MCW7486282.1 hypothetical protein [Leptospira bandrabouensis]
MILSSLAQSLLPHRKNVSLFLKATKGKDDNGEWQDGIAVRHDDLFWPTTNVSTRQFQLSTDGSYTTEDRNFFQLITEEPLFDIKEGDEFAYKTKYFVVKEIKDMTEEAGYLRYICKKKIPQTPPRTT